MLSLIIFATILLLFVFKNGSDGRLDILYYSFYIFKKSNLFFGSGIQKTYSLFNKTALEMYDNGIDNSFLKVYVSNMAIHNSFILSMCINGILFLFLLLLFYFFIFKKMLLYIKMLYSNKFSDEIRDFLIICIYFIIAGFLIACFEDRCIIDITQFVNFTMYY